MSREERTQITQRFAAANTNLLFFGFDFDFRYSLRFARLFRLAYFAVCGLRALFALMLIVVGGVVHQFLSSTLRYVYAAAEYSFSKRSLR